MGKEKGKEPDRGQGEAAPMTTITLLPKASPRIVAPRESET